MSLKNHRVLGRSGIEVSRLGIGSGYGVPAAAIEAAFHEHQINYFYWSTPRRAGMKHALRTLASTHRDRIVIALQSYDHLGLLTRRAVEKGLVSIGTDYADVLILGAHNRIPRRRVLDVARRLKDEGKIRAIAMSGHHRPTFGELAKQRDSPIDIFMVRYNAAHRGAEEEIFPHLAPNNRPGVTSYTATCWGKLLNPKKTPSGEEPLSPADCYRFALTHPAVDLCLTGPKNAEHLSQALVALEMGPMNEEEVARARRIGDFVHG